LAGVFAASHLIGLNGHARGASWGAVGLHAFEQGIDSLIIESA